MHEPSASIRTKAKRNRSTSEGDSVASGPTIPVWLHATQSFYKKLSRVARQCELSRYDALGRGLDALLREHEIHTSPLNKAIKSPGQSEVFRRTMGQVSRKYWATVSAEEKRARGQRSALARWNQKRPIGTTEQP
jgi:hypothetical protein